MTERSSIDWKEIDPDIGKMTDRDVAAKHGLKNYKTVHWRRTKLGIACYDPTKLRKSLTPEQQSDLGLITDAEFAQKHGITRRIASIRRRERGLPPRTRITWTEEMDADLGRVTDRNVSSKYKICRDAVASRRASLGIPPLVTSGKGYHPKVLISPEVISQLGSMPDADLARKAGVSEQLISKFRRERGVPYFRPSKKCERCGEAFQVNRNGRWCDDCKKDARREAVCVWWYKKRLRRSLKLITATFDGVNKGVKNECKK